MSTKSLYERLSVCEAYHVPNYTGNFTIIREFVWAPSSGIFPNGLGGNDGDDEDGYRPSLIDLDMEEASGDSEDASVISPISY
ncbi:hypothetical protein V6N13_072971 [Hibiscus sabdariffa]